jgi:hypothetical protein
MLKLCFAAQPRKPSKKAIERFQPVVVCDCVNLTAGYKMLMKRWGTAGAKLRAVFDAVSFTRIVSKGIGTVGSNAHDDAALA